MIGTSEFEQLKRYIESQSGILFTSYNEFLLENQCNALIKSTSLKGFLHLHQKILVEGDRSMCEALLEGIMTHETYWFRDPSQWKYVETALMPTYIERLRTNPKVPIRIWSGACSYGQEVYSMAMTIQSYLEKNRISDIRLEDFVIVGTDMSDKALCVARNGIYDTIAMSRGVDQSVRDRYFVQIKEKWSIVDEIKQAVHFQMFNLAREIYPEGNYDLILLKNVLIYVSDTYKQIILKNLALSMKEKGILMLGASEIMEDPKRLFVRVQEDDCVYYKKQQSDMIL